MSTHESTTGPLGQQRGIAFAIVLTIITLGIYSLYWVFKTQDEVKEHSGIGVGGVVGLVIYILISPVTFFIVPSEVRYMYEDLDGGQSPVRGIYGLWILLPIAGPIIWFVQVQGALNRYWESKGASPA
jgi:Domain of unknown function (DUF4234)